jgi:hypothetical protein
MFHSNDCDRRAAMIGGESGEFCEYLCGYCAQPEKMPCGQQTCACSHRCNAEGYYPNGRPVVCTEDRCAIWS